MAEANFESNSPAVKKAFDDWQEKALKAMGMFIEGEAVLRCPVSSSGYELKTYKTGKKKGQTYRNLKGGQTTVGGNLRSSIRHIINRADLSVVIGTPVEYAIYVEKGTGIYAVKGDGRKTAWFYVDERGVGHWTRGQRPQPFLTPAAEDNMSKILNIVRKVKFANGVD